MLVIDQASDQQKKGGPQDSSPGQDGTDRVEGEEAAGESTALRAPSLGTVAVVGLGYVGLPVAVAFGKRRPTIGYDLSRRRTDALKRHVDVTGEVSTQDLQQSKQLLISDDPSVLSQADFVIVAVPTPSDAAHQPDFGPLESASRTVGEQLKPGAIVVYESTVYPGATEEVCVPILEKYSGMRWRQDFHVGY